MGTQRAAAAAMAVVGLVAATGIAAGEASTGSDGSDAYQDGWGPSVGDTIPSIAAEDRDGNLRDLASLRGENGLLLVVSRSAVW
ncbi:MAG: hypothetical protein J4F38_14465 [Pseudomonadales bacterium]|nr:hypothetical protein [Pseudomonadales bacterium]